jgi:hypothetical protein
LFGYRSEFLTDTRGEGVLHHRFLGYGPWAGDVRTRDRGVLVCMAEGESVAFSLWNLQERGKLFIGPGIDVYEGMIVGENARAGDLEVNVTKGKKLTNIRAAGADDAIQPSWPHSSSSPMTSSSKSRRRRFASGNDCSSSTNGKKRPGWPVKAPSLGGENDELRYVEAVR